MARAATLSSRRSPASQRAKRVVFDLSVAWPLDEGREPAPSTPALPGCWASHARTSLSTAVPTAQGQRTS
jgi:hypothetical protein